MVGVTAVAERVAETVTATVAQVEAATAEAVAVAEQRAENAEAAAVAIAESAIVRSVEDRIEDFELELAEWQAMVENLEFDQAAMRLQIATMQGTLEASQASLALLQNSPSLISTPPRAEVTERSETTIKPVTPEAPIVPDPESAGDRPGPAKSSRFRLT